MYDIIRVSERIILIKLLVEDAVLKVELLVEDAVLKVLSTYVHQTGLEESTKDAFYDCL